MTEQLLQQFFANQTTPDESRRVLAWFDTDAGQAYLTHRISTQLEQDHWHATPGSPRPDVDRLWATIRQSVQDAPVSTSSSSARSRWLGQSLRWAAACVGTLLLVTGGYWGYKQLYPADLVQQTAFGQTTTLTLPDGSLVTLNGNSRLRYAPQWASGQSREVWLDGEGFFRVTHQPQHERFVVHLPNKLNIEVLGTQFDVLARQSRARVVLNNGKIRLDVGNKKNDRLVMQPGDLFYADVKSKVFYRKRVDPTVQSAWQEGKLRFEGTTLREVAQMLEETYGVQITFTDPALLEQAISGTIPNKDLETILTGLSTLFDLHITRQANQLTIN
ncbi:FecR family protein [Spirosoma rigui]|uniref:FecR family protein n=1 Tax=Spirosoma rigui TaxID=564064 RepID=UPI0009B0B537|nr:FecR domain-containing protein [Spirosoma rigui]